MTFAIVAAMRLLFICGRNRWRSPTAEAVFAAHDGMETLSAGLGAYPSIGHGLHRVFKALG